MFCKLCGNNIDDDSIFCTFCGTKQSIINKPLSGDPSFKKFDEKLEENQSRNIDLSKKNTLQIHPGLVKGSKVALFLFLSFLATGLLLSLSHFGNVPALWVIPFAIVLLYQIIFRQSKIVEQTNPNSNISLKQSNNNSRHNKRTKTTQDGIVLEIHTNLEAGYTVGDKVYIDGKAAPSGKYKMGWMDYLTIENGIIKEL